MGGEEESVTRKGVDGGYRYLLLWLSVFGAAVGLRLPLSVVAAAGKG